MNSPMVKEGPDEMDLLLNRFFKAEMPNPWPAWQAPAVVSGSIRPDQPRHSLQRSRLTLIVAMSLLCALVAMVSNQVGIVAPGNPRPEKGLIENGTAKTPKELLRPHP